MSNPPKKKGSAAEVAAGKWLTAELGRPVERLTLTGRYDRADLRIEGVPLTIEVKSAKVCDLGPWLRELDAERVNNGHAYAVILWKPPRFGLADVGRWVALEPADQASHPNSLAWGAVPIPGPVAQIPGRVHVLDASWGKTAGVGHGPRLPVRAEIVAYASTVDRWLSCLRERLAR